MQVLTSELIKISEENAVKNGTFSFLDLMKNAGVKAGKIIESEYVFDGCKVAVFCGSGNNGGDGFVVADYLASIGADVSVFLCMGETETESARYYFKNVKHLVKTDFSDRYDIIVDAVFGIGLNREISKELADLFLKLNSSKAKRISIDVPSGVHADSGKILGGCFKADLTVTFIALKPCLVLPIGSDYCGKRVVADIGVEPVNGGYEVNQKPIFEKRRHNSHKGDFGTAVMICGSYGMAGAAILAAKAALKSGLGIAKCVVCDGIYSPLTASVPEAVCVPVKQTENGVLNADLIDVKSICEKANALLFGCGVKVDYETEKVLKSILSECEIPCVIDADGINLLSSCIELLKNSKAPVIITPHPGEMARLVKKSVKEVEENRIYYAKYVATKYGCTVVLKGADTIIASSSGEITFNLNGNPGMATGGSGDVLAGITVSMLAQGFEPYTAAKYAVYIHGNAGDSAAMKTGEISLLPSDIISEL